MLLTLVAGVDSLQANVVEVISDVNSNNNYKREYPLPSVVASSTDDGHVKMRKQSSPSPVAYDKSSGRPRFRPLRALSSFRFDSPSITSHPTNNNQRNRHHHQHYNEPSSAIATAAAAVDALAVPPPVHPLAPVASHHSDCKQHASSTHSNNTVSTYSQHTPPETISDIQYMWMAGRKYHQLPSSPYMLPCDDDEVDRLHLLHFMVRFAIQGNYLAPVSDVLRKGGRVLDVGCGPGSWSMEIAGEYPKSQVVGIDINPMFPRDIKPSNCTFHQYNLLDGLPFEDASFDYIFIRFIGLGVRAKQWPIILGDLARLLKPGGWIELAEPDTELYRAGPKTLELSTKLKQVMEMQHIDPQMGRSLKGRLEKRDELTNVTTTFISCPGGQWAGKLGQLTLQSWQAYYQALGPQICHALAIPAKQYEEHLKACLSEANEYKTFENVHFAYAQKKPASTTTTAAS
ncbi:S-adenosyl-L-methionine-dependent methyltransferase [Zychaea mexicana]|uniref:S-adenosyl-L-methionine-dependent methyltransferase n=1 Tax=Zychaea mexicana TaxID=64656 RepID=UPI0022FE23E4|nr:S-adenosyl-L-methionine-dependent methyltransferase [Zychaea mexicana]KAI9497863.1 S-adenosyl-L-methionine-dependent methyltransferase [Zychaea mexicana]